MSYIFSFIAGATVGSVLMAIIAVGGDKDDR